MRFSGKSVASIGVAVVGFLVFAGGTLAQSYDRLAQAQPAPAQPAPAQPAQAQPIWGVNCAGTPNGLDCRAIQAMQMTNTGVMSLAVRVPPETKKPLLILLLPMGIYLPAGVTVRFGQDAAKTVQLQSCDTTGCLAEYALTEAEIAAMLKGQGLTVSVQSQDKQPVSVQVPATGFSAAYAKIK
jgi:invasion protein IalB